MASQKYVELDYMSLEELINKYGEAVERCKNTFEIGNCARSCGACPIDRDLMNVKAEIWRELSAEAYAEIVKFFKKKFGEPEVNGNQEGESTQFEIGEGLILEVSLTNKDGLGIDVFDEEVD